MLVIYVDDFKMGGPEEICHICWKALRSGSDAIQMDDPTTIEAYLGCTQRTHPLKSKRDGKTISVMEYGMKPFLEQCVSSYVFLVGTDSHLSTASTPFIDEDDTSNPC